jgi:hypothetical protein
MSEPREEDEIEMNQSTFLIIAPQISLSLIVWDAYLLSF